MFYGHSVGRLRTLKFIFSLLYCSDSEVRIIRGTRWSELRNQRNTAIIF
jgi:hypothetical protein